MLEGERNLVSDQKITFKNTLINCLQSCNQITILTNQYPCPPWVKRKCYGHRKKSLSNTVVDLKWMINRILFETRRKKGGGTFKGWGKVWQCPNAIDSIPFLKLTIWNLSSWPSVDFFQNIWSRYSSLFPHNHNKFNPFTAEVVHQLIILQWSINLVRRSVFFFQTFSKAGL